MGRDKAQKTLLDGFVNLEKSLKEFQEDLGESAQNDFKNASLTLSKIIEELTEKITELKSNFKTTIAPFQMNLPVNERNQSDTAKINQHLENISNLQNLALTNAEYEEHQKNLNSVKKKVLNNIKEELSELHEKLSVEIIEILNRISVKEELEVVKSALDENSDTLNQEISALKVLSMTSKKALLNRQA